MASHTIYQFYSELDDFKPKIWRRFQVTDDITMARLGYIVMTMYEMTASHLLAIEVPKGENLRHYMQTKFPDFDKDFLDKQANIDGKPVIWRYEIVDDSFESVDMPHIREADATQTRLHHVINEVGERVQVNYDFGDDWWVNLTLEKVFEDKDLPGRELPRILEGSGFGIVEDCGGTPGLDELVKAFRKRKGESYEQFRDWLGIEDFDIVAFDIDDMNFRLKKIPRIYKQCYEDRFRPTQKSIDLIERKYLKK
ncbi:MAG: plasmid pRiA4b ORF-3 family protein, partial [Oscillospiraceae bacterium]|nr:plasmid pRiA4b ORF-3 family protein [Oscillospiraceae bacterium]